MAAAEKFYDAKFFSDQSDDSSRSAAAVVPFLIEHYEPKSVVDVGCGVATWAAVFKAHGVPHVVGIDGEYVPREQLRIDEGSFRAMDLNELEIGKAVERFDLAICLEVAEHLEPASAESLVAFLCASSDCVVFGAAIPGQGGTNHINEQPQSYWAALFERNGFVTTVGFREPLWDNQEIEPHYLQNTYVYRKEAEGVERFAGPLDVVHPRLFIVRNSLLRGRRKELAALRTKVARLEDQHRAYVLKTTATPARSITPLLQRVARKVRRVLRP